MIVQAGSLLDTVALHVALAHHRAARSSKLGQHIDGDRCGHGQHPRAPLAAAAAGRRQPLGGGSSARTSGLATRRHVFACKTCERRFPTFQALGEHRASHRRPKPYNTVGTRRATPEAHEHDQTFPLFLGLAPGCSPSSPGPRSAPEHDEGECTAGGCSVCGLKSVVGQALGGHMRRHSVRHNLYRWIRTHTIVEFVQDSPYKDKNLAGVSSLSSPPPPQPT
ncbi:uncharacterized protein [Setaria viridis]|uniref:uncharacterized protein n=1 Tax=Setaria viridis TaxID=4556 RepID=UPI003B3BAB5B